MPLLALVVFLIAASQVQTVIGALPVMGRVFGVFVEFQIAAALLGAGLGRAMRLPVPAIRAVIFSLGTRNSFVVLPLALALGRNGRRRSVIGALQSLVEPFGMVAYLWIVPRFLAPTPWPQKDKGKVGRTGF